MKRIYDQLVWFDVNWNRPFEFEAIGHLLVHLSGLTRRKQLIWQAELSKGAIRYQLGLEQADSQRVQTLFQAHGDIQFTPLKDNRLTKVTSAHEVKLTHAYFSLNANAVANMVRSSLALSSQLQKHEKIVLQLVIGTPTPPKPIRQDLGNPTASWWQVVSGNIPPLPTDSQKLIKDKLKQVQYGVVVRLGVQSNQLNRDKELANRMLSALKILEQNGSRFRIKPVASHVFNTRHTPWHYPLHLAVSELASLMLLPFGEESLAGIQPLHPKLLLPPLRLNLVKPTKDARQFGETLDKTQPKPLMIQPKDSLYHTVLLGPTGSGKSNVLLQLILADIKAGRSVVVIDPKLDLVQDIVQRLPKERDDDLVILDPTSQQPIGFNPFELVKHGLSAELVADTILAVLKEIFADSWGVYTQDVLSHALLTLARLPEASLMMLPSLLTNDSFRQSVLKQLDDDPLGLTSFWNHYNGLSPSERHQMIAPVLNKLRQFLLRPALRHILGQTNTEFSLTDLLYSRKILLVPLNKGVIGAHSAQLLGSLIVGHLWPLLLRRAEIPPEKRHILAIYIDELQDYLRLPTSLNDALAQSRALGAGWTLAHQFRNQLSPELKSGIDANCKNKIIFGLDMNDAREMARQTTELTPEDFYALTQYQIYAKYQINGQTTGWLSGKTLPAPAPKRSIEELYANNALKYGRPIEVIEQQLQELLSLQSVTSSNEKNAQTTGNIGRRKRPKPD